MTPLIFTTKGNVPLESLRREVEWRIDADVVVFIERYFDGDEVVKESTHVKLMTGVAMDGVATI